MISEGAARWPGSIQRGDAVEFRLGGGLVSWRSGVAEGTVFYGGRHQHYTVRDGAGKLHSELPSRSVRLPRSAAAVSGRRERRQVREVAVRGARGPLRSEDYLAFVRSQPCLLCAAPAPSDPHHYGPRGLGQKTDDYRTVPLCRKCHDTLHAEGESMAGMRRAHPVLLRAQVDHLVRWLRLERAS